MASTLVVLSMLFILIAAVEAQKNSSNLISLGSSLSPSSKPNSWVSPSGLFAFGFYPQGNGFAVGIWIIGHPNNNNTVVWTANRDYPPVSSNSTIEFTGNGRLILFHTQQGTDTELPIAVAANRSAVSASMLDSGNFVVYENETSVIWQSFDSPTDTILGGQALIPGNGLISSVYSSNHSSGRYRLIMNSDGNLVAFPVNQADPHLAYWFAFSPPNPYEGVPDYYRSILYWSTPFSYSQLPGMNDYYKLILDLNGLLYLGAGTQDTSSIFALANASASAKDTVGTVIIYRATFDDDGIFSLYSHRFANNTSSMVSKEWSMLQHRCLVYGFCGINSYCSINGTEAHCNCYPGFAPVNPSKMFMGCYMNFTEQRCINKEGFSSMNIETLEYLRWTDYAYSVETMKKEDCGKYCLKDCYCAAALYFSGQCHKHKLPLRFGIRNSSDLVTAFVKIGNASAKIFDPLAPNSPSGLKTKGHLISIFAASLGSLISLCIVIAISSFFMYRHRVHKYKKLSGNAKLGLTTDEFSLRSFSYNELEEATQGFSEELGKGSFGTVYKGTLLSGGVNKNIVAVMKLENVVKGDREFHFQTEVTAIGRTHHRNLVRLLGFCVEGKRKLLVYEYMSNGSLADVLFQKDESRRPDWKERVKIALDIARGILYLHEECEACIVHCGIKPQNILMDHSGTAKICDFGLAKLLMPNHMQSITGQSKRVAPVTATAGTGSSYLAPEWQQQRRKKDLISVKADIYSFGVVLLEVICCRRNIEVGVSDEDEMILSTWVYKCFAAGELYKLLVGDEEMRVEMKTLERMVKVGLWCVQDDPDLRPPIKNVMLMLEGIMNIPLPPDPHPVSLLDN